MAETDDLRRHGGPIACLADAPAIFVGHAARLFQERSDLIPDDLFQLVAAHRSVAAHSLAVEPSAPVQR